MRIPARVYHDLKTILAVREEDNTDRAFRLLKALPKRFEIKLEN